LQGPSWQVPALQLAVAFATMQLPQSSIVPHPESAGPQERLSETQVLAVQPHWFWTPPPPQVCGDTQEPQSMTLLHWSETLPHEASSCAQVLALQLPVPHLFGPPPPQVSPDGHVPHSTSPPQPSSAVPHSASTCWQLLGTHPHWF
jgi:hypothetical protein